MKTTTRLIALFWLLVGASIWWSALANNAPTPFSLRFFATIQVMGGIFVLMRLTLGWVFLITMSVFMMVTGLFALLTTPFMPDAMLQNAPSLLGLPPRWLAALAAAVGVIIGRLCWVGLSKDPPSRWEQGTE
ncbi:MAG: hypothetical protein KatS3mg020_1202 [Fimbriimonadales bacterium]|nr:MAG: hypothetical protein KatS3mg020_1202 [Fimbriimonadales bacterium]